MAPIENKGEYEEFTDERMGECDTELLLIARNGQNRTAEGGQDTKVFQEY